MDRDTFFHQLDRRSDSDLKLVQRAYWLAKEVHRRTPPRDSGERYFEHPRRVALSLMGLGHQGTGAVVAALLHDVVEDTYTPAGAIINLFGIETWDRVFLLSKKIPHFDEVTGQVVGHFKKDETEYFNALLTSGDETALTVKAADRLDNLTTCGCWEPPRIARYVAETEQYVLPIARMADERLASRIEAKLIALRG